MKLKNVMYWLLLATLLLPLGYTSWTTYPANFGKVLLFQILIDILLIGVFLMIPLLTKEGAGGGIRRQLIRFKPNLIDWLVLGFTTVSVLATITARDPWQSFWGDQSRAIGLFYELHLLAFYLLARNLFTEKRDWSRVLGAVVGAGVLSSIIAFIGPPLPLLGQYLSEGRLSGLVGNPIFFANYLLLPIFLGLFSFFYFGSRTTRYAWLWVAGSVVIFAALLGSNSRGPILGMAAGALISIFVYIVFTRSKKARLSMALGAVLIAVIIGAGFASFAVQKAYPRKLQYIFSISPKDITAQTRLMAWAIAWRGWQDSPALGQGIGSYRQVYSAYYNPDFLKFSFYETVWDEPHNYPLELLVTRGILGLAAYAALLAAITVLLGRKIRVAPSEREKAAFSMLLGGIWGYAVSLMFSFETSNSWQLWFVVLALAAWLKTDGKTVSTFSIKPRIVQIVLGAVVLVSAAAAYYNIQMLRGSYYTSLARDAAELQSLYQWQQFAEKALSISTPIQYDQAVFLAKDLTTLDALGLFDRDKQPLLAIGPKLETIFQERLAADADSYWHKIWLAQMYTMLGQYADVAYYAKGEQVFKEAWELNNTRQQVQLLLAKLYLLQDKDAEGTEVLEGLVAQNPDFAEPHWYLGIALMKQGEIERGTKELELGERHGLGYAQNVDYVIDAYAKAGKYDKIALIYERLVSENPQEAQYHARLAATYVALGEKEKALEAIVQAVALDPALRAEAEQFIIDNNL